MVGQYSRGGQKTVEETRTGTVELERAKEESYAQQWMLTGWDYVSYSEFRCFGIYLTRYYL